MVKKASAKSVKAMIAACIAAVEEQLPCGENITLRVFHIHHALSTALGLAEQIDRVRVVEEETPAIGVEEEQ